MSYVYVAKSENRMVKIGVTTDLNSRMSSLSCGSGFTVYLEYARRSGNAVMVESMAHSKLSPYRKRGEWFEIDVDLAIAVVEGCFFACSAFQVAKQRCPESEIEGRKRSVNFVDSWLSGSLSCGSRLYRDLVRAAQDEGVGGERVLHKAANRIGVKRARNAANLAVWSL